MAIRTVAIIQARMNSARLPGKVLRDLVGEPMLARVVRRLRRASSLDNVVVATTDSPADVPVVEACALLDVRCFRGEEQDVLGRFYHAAQAAAAEAVVRITADCPLADPEVIDTVVGAFLEHTPDYASNTLCRTWPRGLDTEICTFEALARAWLEADQPYQRVHVTPYLYQNPHRFRLLAVTAPEDHSDLRWTVDTAEDLALIQAIYAHFDGDDSFSWRDVLRLVEQRPWLAVLNRHVRQRALIEG